MEIVGLLKFFKDKKYLEDLLSGVVYCNTPEYYRLCDVEGIGDRNESCVSSYRIERDGKKDVLKINGHMLSGVQSVTMRKGGLADMYLHCWVAVSMPQNEGQYRSLLSDINRMRTEFGCNYAFMAAKDIDFFVDTVASDNNVSGDYRLVKYSEDSHEWCYWCKSDKYLYQREFRFLFDRCDTHDVEPRKLICKKDFSNILYVNEPLTIIDSVTKELMFCLDLEKCYSGVF